MITGAQVRAARALLNLSQQSLADAAGVTRATLAYFESGKNSTYDTTVQKIVGAMEARGILFVENDRGRGVLLSDSTGVPMRR